MTTLDTAITTLLSEYDHLDGVLTAPATGWRTLAMERVTGAIFRAITDQLDPHGIDDLDEQIADETLSCSLFLSSRLVGAMLDFREAAAQHGCSLASYRDRLHRMLLEIGDSFQQDLFDHLESLDQDDDGDSEDDDNDGEGVGV